MCTGEDDMLRITIEFVHNNDTVEEEHVNETLRAKSKGIRSSRSPFKGIKLYISKWIGKTQD